MPFCEKLDFLMNITKTTNSSLARCASLDASYISRLRTGTRTPAKNENYIRAMSDFFARCCKQPYQKNALLDKMKAGSDYPADEKAAAMLIYQWLLAGSSGQANPVEGFLSSLTGSGSRKAPSDTGDAYNRAAPAPYSTAYYYGPQGKRQAVLDFLTLVLERETPQTLLLFSDEDIGWMTENREFAAQWAYLLSQVILRGNKIKIIHTVSRDIDEMLMAIGQWLPIYMTGSIDPYYYPKIRDGVFKRTLFIAPGTAAVVSTCVGARCADAANLLIRDVRAVASFSEEFSGYLALCRPLMRIYTAKNIWKFFTTLSEFENEQANALIKTDTLSAITMPLSVRTRLCERADDERMQLLSLLNQRIHTFTKGLKTNRLHEIISLADAKSILAGDVRYDFINLPGRTPLFYTPEEYCLHLKNIVYLLENESHYTVSIDDGSHHGGYMLYVKENLGTLVAKTPPSVVFAVNESKMTAAFWDYLSHEFNRPSRAGTGKKETISALSAVIRELENSSAAT